jgi:hypothetical protein
MSATHGTGAVSWLQETQVRVVCIDVSILVGGRVLVVRKGRSGFGGYPLTFVWGGG